MADLLRNLHFLILRVAHWAFYHWSIVKWEVRQMKKFILVILAICVLMFAEYRYIMLNIKPYIGYTDNNGGVVYLEIFGQVDEYYAETID